MLDDLVMKKYVELIKNLSDEKAITLLLKLIYAKGKLDTCEELQKNINRL